MDVVDDVQEASFVMPQLSAKSLPQDGAVSWTPHSHWLYSASVKTEPVSQSWQPQGSKFELPVGALGEPALHDWYASKPPGLMVYAKIT